MRIKSETLLFCVTCLIVPSSSQLGVFNYVKDTVISVDDQMRNFQEGLVEVFQIKHFHFVRPDKIAKITYDLDLLAPTDLLPPIGRRPALFDKTFCEICQLLIFKVQKKTLAAKVVAEALCTLYITLSTWTVSNFCEEMININLPVIEYVLENSTIIDPELACSIFLQNKKCYYEKSPLKWRIPVPSASQKKTPAVTFNPSSRPLKILHLTDFHISPDYEVGGIEDCGYPVCCKKGLGNSLFGGNAGAWGDYECDIPVWTYMNALQHINSTHTDIDLVYFTGDIIDHTVWKSSEEENTKMIYYTFKALHETFPNIPVLSVIGNHEALPLNVFSPPHIKPGHLSTQWLYTLMSKVWRPWLPQEALRTVARQGYYSYFVNNKLKVIALNNNICYIFNWWLLYNTTFLDEQLIYLSNELQQAEENGVFVHIIAHVPVGNKECIEPWEVGYNALIERFSHIIKGQFFGHTHTDELKVFYDKKRKPINVGYNGASLTTYKQYNPNYKVITVDTNAYEILDIDTYIYNLTEANLNPAKGPQWYKLYSMKEGYGLSDLSPRSIDKLATMIWSNKTVSTLYWRYYVRDGDAALKEGCDEACRKEIVCKIFTTESLFPQNDGCA